MARIALGIAGGIIGGIIGGPAGFSIGFSLGSLAGGLLFPPHLPTQYGPRLNDKQITSSAEGEPIPWGYGGFRIAGNIIWADKIKEVKTTQHQSAKGGPSQTTVSYTYTCSFAIGFCEGPGTIVRMWADSKLIYDTTGKAATTLDTGITNSGGVAQTVHFTPTLYTGTQTQGPDPTIQTALGVGLTPGYRGIVYAVFTNFPLADFGNRIPSIRAEVSTGNVTAYVKDAYRALSTVENVGTGSPAVGAASHCVVDSINRIGYIFGVHGQSVMAVDLNVDGATPLGPWLANTVFELGSQILDSNGNVQYVSRFTGTPHTSAGTAPAWATVDGLTTSDHNIVWMKIGVGPNAITVLREGLLDPTTKGLHLASAGSFGGDSMVCTVDTRGNLWGSAQLADADPGGSSYFAVRYDPITFKATGVFDTNIFQGIPPSIISIAAVRVNQAPPSAIQLIFGGIPGPDQVYITLGGSGGASESLAIVDAKSMKLISVGEIFPNILFGDTTHYFSTSGELLYPAIDPNTGIAYYMLNDASRPVIGLTTWYVMKIDPRNGYDVVPVPLWGINTGQWRGLQVFSFPVNLPFNTTDGYPHCSLYDATDNTLLCFSGTSTAGFSVVKKIDCTLGTLIANTPLASNSYTTETDFQTYFAPGYKGLVPADGLVKVMDKSQKNMVYINSSDLSISKTVALNNWEPAIGSGIEPLFVGFGFDVATNSSLVTPSTYQPIPLRMFFDRQVVQAQSLDQVVSDLLQRAGVAPSNIDVSALVGINCLGYVIARTSDAKAALQPLCTAFFFDLVESDFKIKAVLRGQMAAQNIPEDDLGLSGDQYKLVETIAQEQDLPKTVSVEYQDPALNYQQGKQAKYRHSRVKKSKNHDILTLPITLNGDDAAHIADKYLAMLWAERNMYDSKLWAAKYLVIDPTDVVQFTYEGLPFQARIVRHSLGQNKVLELSGVNEDAREYLSVLGGAGTQGFQTGSILPSGATLLFWLDTPLLQDIDANGGNTGFYYLMSSPTIGTWPGANLYQSGDSQNFGTLDSDFDEATYGVVVDATPDAAFGNGVLHPFSWDTLTTVTVRLAQGSLSSTAELAVLNGANGFILGGEVMQFQNAVLNSDGTYTLSKLLRGRRGSEANCHFHQAGETFLLLNNATKRVQQSSSVIGLLRYYRAVTLGQPVTSGLVTTDTLQGNDLKPYSPAQFTGSFDASHNINCSWVRRTRVGGAWFNGVGDVPLSEEGESYDFDVMWLNFGGTKQQHYASSPAGTLVQTVYNQFSGFYELHIAAFTLAWDDGTVASYNGTVITGPSVGLAAPGPRFVWVHDTARQGDTLIQASGVTYGYYDTTLTGAFPNPHPDSLAIPPNNTGSNSGYYLVGVIPTFVAGQPPSYYTSGDGGDSAMRKFISLNNPNVSYTAAQILADFGYQLDTAFGATPYIRARVYQKSAVVSRGFGTDNPTIGKGTIVSGGSDATSILGVPITGTPVDGDVLQYNGTANEWQIVGPLLKRKSVVKTTASLGNGSSETGSIAVGWKTGVLLSVEGSAACRVQLYATSAAQTADAGRAANTPPDPLTQNEILADVLLAGGGDETWICSPPLICANMDSTPAQTLYYRITNNSGATSAITATLVMVPIEN